ncbi:hypothetical protein [Couchioplanes azureus]|uniref:hypothetical protein n=1 Tax=Couchioplanes caeruleus TaxID=56438 RepID=UPI0016707FC3|nr:hypothetical protein [Couchioplanes caeruleus]GGQ44556.1 hypothetical protein GCM10010166_11380 [Couchioplanes caeruleus subsp. azureus]
MLGRDMKAAQESVRSWTGQVPVRAQTTAKLSDRAAGITPSVTGAGGAMRVTVTASGGCRGW